MGPEGVGHLLPLFANHFRRCNVRAKGPGATGPAPPRRDRFSGRDNRENAQYTPRGAPLTRGQHWHWAACGLSFADRHGRVERLEMGAWKRCVIGGALALSAIGAQAAYGAAEPVVWKCTLPQTVDHGWISGIYVVRDDAAGHSMAIVDPLIQFEGMASVPGKIKSDDGKKVTFKWQVRSRKAAPHVVTIDFTGSLNRATREFRVMSRPVGYDNTENFLGTCEISR